MSSIKNLITGGAGFVGSHLAEALLNLEEEVYIIDDLTTGSIENIEHLKTNDNFHYFIDTIENEMLMAELVDKCDIIYHLAAAVGVRLILENPVRTIKNNVNGTDIALKLANKKKKKILITSTSEVYGKGIDCPFKENFDLLLGSPVNSRWSYACSKALDEFLALAYYKDRKLPVIITRLFNTVGPRQTGNYGMVIPTFIKQALSDVPITIYGTGKQSRCFAHVKDVVKALIKLIKNPDAIGQIVNIGSNDEITIMELAQLVKEMANSKSDIICISYDQAYEKGFEDMERRVPDLTKLQRLINMKPSGNIKEIIDDVIQYTNKKFSRKSS